MVSNGPKWSQPIPNSCKWVKTVLISHKWSQIVPNGPKWQQMSKKGGARLKSRNSAEKPNI